MPAFTSPALDIRAEVTRTTDWRKDFWRRYETDAEHQERVNNAEREANWFLKEATAPALQEHRDTMCVIAAYYGSPKWTRLRDEADRKYREATREAAELFDITAAEVMRDGEVSEATSDRWDLLCKLNGVAKAMEEVA